MNNNNLQDNNTHFNNALNPFLNVVNIENHTTIKNTEKKTFLLSFFFYAHRDAQWQVPDTSLIL